MNLDLMVRLQSRILGNLEYHFFTITIRVPYMGQREQFSLLSRININIWKNWAIGQMSKMFASGPGDRGSI